MDKPATPPPAPKPVADASPLDKLPKTISTKKTLAAAKERSKVWGGT